MFKKTVELTQKIATGKVTSQSWYSYLVTNGGHYYAIIIDCL